MNVPVEPDRKAVNIPDGIHTGMVMEVKTSENNYQGKVVQYLDLTLTVNDVAVDGGLPATIRAGYPLPIRPSSMSGQLLTMMGIPVTAGTPVNPELLKGRMVQYMTVQKAGKKDPTKKYSEVIRESLKPYPAVLKVG